MEDDKSLAEMIRLDLVRKHELPSSGIQVQVRDRVVTLRGHVPDELSRRQAECLVKFFHGVRQVINDLKVLEAGLLSDEQITDNVRQALRNHPDIRYQSIVVTVENGRAILTGAVPAAWYHTLVEDVVQSACGVRAVQNDLLVDQVGQATDESLSQELQKVIASSEPLRSQPIAVGVNGDLVVLSGEVRELWQKTNAEDVVRRFRHCRIRNEIRVQHV